MSGELLVDVLADALVGALPTLRTPSGEAPTLAIASDSTHAAIPCAALVSASAPATSATPAAFFTAAGWFASPCSAPAPVRASASFPITLAFPSRRVAGLTGTPVLATAEAGVVP